MHSASMKAFVKEALEIQTTDQDTPPGYMETRAAVLRKFANLAAGGAGSSGVAAAAGGNAPKIPSAALSTGGPMGGPKMPQMPGATPAAPQTGASLMKMGSTGRHLLELAGLGVLAAPAATHLATKGKKEWSEKNKAKAEVGGLGMLAAPYAHDLARDHIKPYGRMVGRLASRLHK